MNISTTEALRVAKTLAGRFPGVSSVKRYNDARWYVNLDVPKSTYRGNANFKAWFDLQGVLHLEQGPGMTSPEFQEVRNTFLDAVAADGMQVEGGRPFEISGKRVFGSRVETAPAPARADLRVEVSRWVEDCDGSVRECNTDYCVKYANPDGTTVIVRTHSH